MENWIIYYDDCETSSYRVEMVEVMITNQDIIIINLKTDTNSYIILL